MKARLSPKLLKILANPEAKKRLQDILATENYDQPIIINDEESQRENNHQPSIINNEQVHGVNNFNEGSDSDHIRKESQIIDGMGLAY